MENVQGSQVRGNVGGLVKSILLQDMKNNPDRTKEPKELLKERADKERDMLKELKDFIREKGNEIKWTGEYIAAVIGIDRTPQAELARRANITRKQFVMMKKEMNRGHETRPEHDQKER